MTSATTLSLGVALATLAAAPPAKPKWVTPGDVVAAAPASAWTSISPDDLLLIDLAGGRRVTIQLAPAFAPVHVANIRALARAGWWAKASVYRVQDNYVAQWGNNDGDGPLPPGVVKVPPPEYARSLKGLAVRRLAGPDPYAPAIGHAGGWAVALYPREELASLTHCYGTVGVGRDLSPDTGMGGELYAVIGHGPRQLDRNIAIVGRVVDGIDAMSSLPRGTEALGFYKDKAQGTVITNVRLAAMLPAPDRPAYEMMDTASASFAHWVRVRANRRDDFYIRPAGGVDLCNAPVPVRRVKPS